MSEIVAVDIGGTHARFAIAEVGAGRLLRLGEPVTLRTADYESFGAAWRAFDAGRSLPRKAAIAVAAPVGGETVTLTNNAWTIQPEALDLDAHLLINDFEAVGHAVLAAGPEHFLHLCGPDRPFGRDTISVVGPGTGLGVASVRDGRVQPTEGGHAAFAPLDEFEDRLLETLRRRHGRVSIERLVSGHGLVNLFEALCEEKAMLLEASDRVIWDLALSGQDEVAVAALDRFCCILGSIAGDVALVQGGFGGVVIAGGLGLRLKGVLPRSGFAARFVAKGRFETLMASIPVKLITHPQPGLFGATAAFAKEYS